MDQVPPVRHPHLNVYADKPKVAALAKGKTRVLGRKTLGDLSNISQRFIASSQVNKSQPNLDAKTVVNEQLQKENAALIKLLADKNTVIAISSAEVQKLRVTLQMVRQQNVQLAQSNTQLQSELNSIKESQKTLNHELGCKNGLLIAKNLELEGMLKTEMRQANNSDVTEQEDTKECRVAENGDDKHLNTISSQISESLVPSDKIDDIDMGKARRLQTRRRQSARFKLDDQKIENDDDLPPEMLQTRRRQSERFKLDDQKIESDDDLPPEMLQTRRRQSARFKLDDQKTENDDDLPPSQLPDDDKIKVNDSEKKDKEVDQDCKPLERKTSILRPVREAAKKVQSYKEIKVNVKMRREHV